MRQAVPAVTYETMLRELAYKSKQYGIDNELIGILLTRPDLETGKNILNSLEYFHFRTKKDVDLYLAGYSTHCDSDDKEVTKIDGAKWYFSNKMFANFIAEFEGYSKWSYSGGSELILISYNKGQILHKKAMIFYLDQMLRDNVIISIQDFFEDLIRLCKDKQTLTDISNAFGRKIAKKSLEEIIRNKLPAKLGEIFIQEKFFCVKNIAK